ncbi:MAG: nucleotidyltransferase family protein [Chloroflexi bacterium]|nr:nucleotidyltransferase family protein [Chloroflexota bacterium]
MYAMTIVGGRGERLRPYTDTVPKPMVPVNDRPLISYQIDWMRNNGVTDVVFLTGYMEEKFREYIGDGSALGINAHYSNEDTPLGRGGAVKQGLQHIPDSEEMILVCNGDVITDQSLEPLKDLQKTNNAIATITLVPYPNQYGVVRADDDAYVTSFAEKAELNLWINGGIYLFTREIDDLLPDIGDHETETFPQLAQAKRMAAYKSSAYWTSVESQKELREAGEYFK